MARRTAPLTATEIKSAKPKEKKYKLSDGRGLALHVLPNGSKLWILKYRFNAKEKEYSIGAYPTITLSKARERREELKKLVSEGIDPNKKKQRQRAEAQKVEAKKENTFYKVSQLWLKSYESQVSENYHTRLGRALTNYLYPTIKHIPMEEVTRLQVIAILDDLKDRDLLETAKRTAMLLNKIYKYAVTFEYTPHNIIADIELKTVLGKREKKHYPTFTKDKDIKGLLNNIDEYSGDYSTKMALKVLPYVFVRSYNIRHMKWEEIDFKAKEWVIPAEKMKGGKEQTLPLTHEAMQILKERKPNKKGKFVFASNGKTGHLVEPKKGWIRILKRAGIENLRLHDLRRTLGSWQARTGASLAIIGKTLAHKDQKTTAIYARLDNDPVRESMEKATSAMMNAGEQKADVVPIKKHG